MGQDQDQIRRKDEELTGRDLPDADGQVSDEATNAIDDRGTRKKTGQDHSTDILTDRSADSGVGAVQDSSDTLSDSARIRD